MLLIALKTNCSTLDFRPSPPDDTVFSISIMWNPLGDAPLNHTSPWTAEPTRRGTYNILSTCLITMGLRVWTAIHLNLPENKKTTQQYWRKFGWLILGLLAPEMVCGYGDMAASLIAQLLTPFGLHSPHSSNGVVRAYLAIE